MAAVVGAAVAFAIAGAAVNEGVKSLDGYHSDLKRHNLVMEELTRKRNRWYQERQIKLDRLNERIMDITQSQHKFKELDDALDYYHRLNPHYDLSQYTMEEFPNNNKNELKDIGIIVGIAASLMYLWKNN